MARLPHILSIVLLTVIIAGPLGCQTAGPPDKAVAKAPPDTSTSDTPVQDDQTDLLQWLVTKLLGNTAEQRRQELLESLTSPDADIRREGAALLGTEPSAHWETTPEILRMMALGDINEHVRATALHTLAKVGPPDALTMVLAKAAGDPSALVRAECVAATCHVPDEPAVAILTGLLDRDPEPDVRRVAAAALANHREQQAINTLVAALADDDFGVCHTARQSLKQLTGRDLGDDPDAWRQWLFADADPLSVPAQ